MGNVAVQAVIAGSHHPAPAHVLNVVVVAEGSGTDVDILLSESGHAHSSDNHHGNQNQRYDFFHGLSSFGFRHVFDIVVLILTRFIFVVNSTNREP